MDIEKGVKPPKVTKKKSGNRLKYNWHEMETGDSFVIEGITSQQACSISSSGRSYFKRKKKPLKIIHKRENEDSVRFWAVKN